MQRILFLLLVFAVTVSTAPALADGDFYVIAGGGGVGTKITNLPYTIEKPGFYYLGLNLSMPGYMGSAVITINADHVIIDLMGFNLQNTPGQGLTNGIYMNGRTNVEIRNGTLNGFAEGIYEGSGSNHRIINVRIFNSKNYGIFLQGNGHLVQGCQVSNCYSGISVYSGKIANCVATDNTGGEGIKLFSGTIANCVTTGNQVGIRGEKGSILDNIANNNTGVGFYFDYGGINSILIDRNSATGNATNYSGGGSNAIWGLNAGR